MRVLRPCVWEAKGALTRYLLGKGANVNLGDPAGVTPLHVAVRTGQLRMCRLVGRNPVASLTLVIQSDLLSTLEPESAHTVLST